MARETLLLNIGKILIDRVHAYRLHRREKEGLELFRAVTRTSPRCSASLIKYHLVLEADMLRVLGFRHQQH